MSLPTLIFTRPMRWAMLDSDVVELAYHPPAAKRLLRDGRRAGDSMGTVFDAASVRSLLAAFKKSPPDIFLFWTHFGVFTPDTVRRLRKLAPNTIFVHGTGNQVMNKRNRDWYVERIKKYIDVQTTNTSDPRRIGVFKKCVPNVFTLHDIAIDRSSYTLPKGAPEYDCFFGGGDSVYRDRPNGRFPGSLGRHELVKQVSKRYSLLLRGGGKWNDHGIKFLPGITHTLEYFREMQKAKIVLGFNHIPLQHYYTKRTILGGASGRLLITKYIPGMEDHFTNHKDVVWFNSVDEGMELIDHYLKAENERINIAARQRRRFVELHSWEARLREFERLVPRLLKCRSKGKRK